MNMTVYNLYQILLVPIRPVKRLIVQKHILQISRELIPKPHAIAPKIGKSHYYTIEV